MTTKYQKGQARPQGSGMPAGKKTAKVVKREAYWDETREERAIKSRTYAGMTPQEIMEAEDYNPIVELMYIAKDENEKPDIRFKANESLARKVFADLKSVENTGDAITTVQVVWGGSQAPSVMPPKQHLIDAPLTAIQPPSKDDEEPSS